MKPGMGINERFARFKADISTAGSYRQATFPCAMVYSAKRLPGQEGPARDSRTPARTGGQPIR